MYFLQYLYYALKVPSIVFLYTIKIYQRTYSPEFLDLNPMKFLVSTRFGSWVRHIFFKKCDSNKYVVRSIPI